MTEDKKGSEELKEYADGWMTERKGTDAPGFLKLVIPIIGLGCTAYLVMQMKGYFLQDPADKRLQLVDQFNAATKSSPALMYGIAAMALIYVVIVSVFAFRKPHED